MVIILNGVGRSGKGTVYNFMNEIIPGIQYSWIDFARNMMRESGIPVDKKTPEIRKCLADVGMALEGLDIPYRDCINIISNVSRGCINDIHNVYLDCREPRNIDRIKEYCKTANIKCVTIYVKRNNIKCPDNFADKAAEQTDYFYDYTIYNNGTLEELKRKCVDICREI